MQEDKVIFFLIKKIGYNPKCLYDAWRLVENRSQNDWKY